MLYESTRGGQNKVTGPQAVIRGIAEDKGLFVPSQIPKLSPTITKALENGSTLRYKDVAAEVIETYFDDLSPEELKKCIDGAYDEKFTASDIVELVKVEASQGADVNFLELYHGKTAAFKDMALSILPYLMVSSCKAEGEKSKICILTATSGDTGKAALEGFADVPGTEIIVFYPKDGVSQVQERQMVSQEGANTHVFAIKGNFDDAQKGVKDIFADEKFNEMLESKGIKLSSANSINIGRLVPQIAYYVYSYVMLVSRGQLKNGEPMNVVVPTGNFGNILAAYFAREMGIPIKKLICASNENNVLTDFIKSGVYDIRGEKRSFCCTNSPSMDILISSNLERLLYLLSGRDARAVKEWMAGLDGEKNYRISPKVMDGMKDFYGGYATEDETLSAIHQLWNKSGYLMDTHTAVAYKVYCDYVSQSGDDKTPVIIASTASPYKFAESVARACDMGTCTDGFEYVEKIYEESGVKIPYGLVNLGSRPIRHTGVIEKDQMREAVLQSVL